MRRSDQPKRVTNRSIIARWVEAETLHLKRLGMGYQEIADHIIAVAQGQQRPMVPIPPGAHFPADYRISLQAVHHAFRRAIVRQPNAEAAELRKLDSERLEDMFLSLQAGIRQGDTRCIEVAVRVLAHKAEINGYKAPARVEMTGSQVNVLVQGQTAAIGDLSRLTIEELREYRRLEAKALGEPEVTEIEALNAPDGPDQPAPIAEPDRGNTEEDKE